MKIQIVIDTDDIRYKILRWWNNLMEKTPYNYLPKFISWCYNYYYKRTIGPILDSKARYELQKLIDSNDTESQLLGISMLINYSAGSDELYHCSYRMTWASDWEIQHKTKNKPIEWFKVGDLQLYKHIKIQEIINELKKIYLSLPEDLNNQDKLAKCLNYLSPIKYWFRYHPRIGSNICSFTGPVKYPDPNYQNEQPSFYTFGQIYTWDWRTKRYRWPINIEDFWKTHNKDNYISN